MGMMQWLCAQVRLMPDDETNVFWIFVVLICNYRIGRALKVCGRWQRLQAYARARVYRRKS